MHYSIGLLPLIVALASAGCAAPTGDDDGVAGDEAAIKASPLTLTVDALGSVHLAGATTRGPQEPIVDVRPGQRVTFVNQSAVPMNLEVTARGGEKITIVTGFHVVLERTAVPAGGSKGFTISKAEAGQQVSINCGNSDARLQCGSTGDGPPSFAVGR